MSSYHYHHTNGGGSGYGGLSTAPTIGAALDELMCGKSEGSLSSVSSNVSPNSMFFSSILMRDLDLSEDSDADQASEEMNLSECQSKKGKVISATAEASNTRAAVLRMSSSSSTSSSSDSSSDSGDDDDDNDGKDRRKKTDAEKSSESRLSSSSSSTSSSSDEEEEEEVGDGDVDDNKKAGNIEDVKGTVDRGEKTPSPNSKQGLMAPVTLGTPTTVTQENPEANLSWGLEHFMQPRRTFGSPANVSPYKSASPPMLQSVQQQPIQLKDDAMTLTTDQNRPRTLRDMGQCDTMSFEMQAQKVSEYDGDDNLADEEDDDGDESTLLKKKNKITNSSKKVSESSLAPKSSDHSKQTEFCKRAHHVTTDNRKSVVSKEAQVHTNSLSVDKKFVDPLKKELVMGRHSSSTNITVTNRKKTGSPVASSNTGKLNIKPAVAKAKTVAPGSCSSSNDEIDVVSYTPDEKIQQRRSSSPDKTLSNKRGILELSKKLFNGALSESSDDDSKTSQSRGKNTEIKNTKRYKRTSNIDEHSSSSMPLLMPQGSNSVEISTASPSGASVKTSKKDNAVALGHLEAISKPPNLLLPAHAIYSSPPVGSTKPLPPFHASFSTLHSSTSVMPPYVTLTRNADGTSRPKIMVQIHHSFLSKKIYSWIKEKKDRRKKSQRDVHVSEPPKYESPSDLSKESRVPSISDHKSSQRSSDSHIKNGDAQNAHRNGEHLSTQSLLPTPSKHSIKSSKYKSRESSTSALDNGTVFNPQTKTLSSTKSSSKETHSSTSSSSLLPEKTSTLPTKSSSSFDLSTTTAPNGTAVSLQTKSSNSASCSPQVVPGKTSGSSAVKNLHFTEDTELNANESKSDKSRQFKRKLDILQVSPKKNKSDSIIDKVSNSAPAAVNKRRDSANSTSSKGSHQSSKSRHISINNKKNINSNNNVENTNAHITNGPENSNLPFNHYVNGNISGSNNSNGIVNPRAPSSLSSLPANLPPPSPIETQLHTTQHYLARATEHKHHADNLKDKLAKYEPYLRSGLSFFLAGYSMELSKRDRDQNTSYSMYNDTSNLLQYVIRMRATSSSNPESSDKERKLIVLIIRLQAYLNHRMYRLKGPEVSKLKKVIESEQAKYQTSSTTTVTTSSSTNASTAVSSKPHAPSPHQTHWNKNSTGTPSPMSPTPSPAGSVSSQGSCELVPGRIQNGNNSSSSTPLTSPSPGMVSVHQRVHAVTQKYFILTSHMVKALELWDQADVESKGFEELFTVLDNACGPLTFHSDPPVIVRYMKHALRLLNL